MVAFLADTGDGTHRTVFGAFSAALAVFRIDDELPHGLADLGAALMIPDMFHIFLAEGC